ncbi:MAG TPA: hypothetical protein VIK99_01165 [Thermaerobacter sp.]
MTETSIADRLRGLDPRLRDNVYRLAAIDELMTLADEVKRLEQDVQRTRKVLGIVLREMRAYGSGWRADWSDFDGRTLRDQLDRLAVWALAALAGETDDEYRDGTKFCEAQWSG